MVRRLDAALKVNTGVLILSSLGGIVSFVTGLFFVGRAIMKNVGATRDNTKALVDVKDSMQTMRDVIDVHTIDIAVLKDRIGR